MPDAKPHCAHLPGKAPGLPAAAQERAPARLSITKVCQGSAALPPLPHAAGLSLQPELLHAARPLAPALSTSATPVPLAAHF